MLPKCFCISRFLLNSRAQYIDMPDYRLCISQIEARNYNRSWRSGVYSRGRANSASNISQRQTMNMVHLSTNNAQKSIISQRETEHKRTMERFIAVSDIYLLLQQTETLNCNNNSNNNNTEGYKLLSVSLLLNITGRTILHITNLTSWYLGLMLKNLLDSKAIDERINRHFKLRSHWNNLITLLRF